LTIRHYNVFMSVAHDYPLYSRVETVLASEIADGNLKIGDQLPTEDSLITRFEVSRITVRRAIQNLVSRGLVEIRRRKGTFVAAPKITQELTELSGFVEDRRARTDLCGGRSMMVVPTATVTDSVTLRQDTLRYAQDLIAGKGRFMPNDHPIAATH
jgi:GntR family transcriptional regulator